MASDIDDGSVPDDDWLHRRIHPSQVVTDGNTGKLRPSSAAFKDPEMSVDSEYLLHRAGLDWRFSLKDHPEHSLVRFRAGIARKNSLSVVPDPLPRNPAHVMVRGRKSPGTANRLRDASEWVAINGNPV